MIPQCRQLLFRNSHIFGYTKTRDKHEKRTITMKPWATPRTVDIVCLFWQSVFCVLLYTMSWAYIRYFDVTNSLLYQQFRDLQFSARICGEWGGKWAPELVHRHRVPPPEAMATTRCIELSKCIVIKQALWHNPLNLMECILYNHNRESTNVTQQSPASKV